MLNIVLYEPEMAANVGNIMRTCVALDAKLHIIKPTPLSFAEKDLKRAGLDYIAKLRFVVYDNFLDFSKQNICDEIYFITRYGKKIYSDANFSDSRKNIFVVFGNESHGINYDILRENEEKTLRIPMVSNARSLNLANTVAVVAYEVLRQQNFNNLATKETIKTDDFIH